MKPVGRLPQKKDELLGDADALVVQEVLGQNAPADILTPTLIPGNLHSLVLSSPGHDAMDSIIEAYSAIARGRDITLVSGTGAFPATGRFAGADGFTLLRALGLKMLMVERFHRRCINYDSLLLIKDALGDALIGVVLNDVPEEEMRDAENLVTPWLASRGIKVYGIMAHEPGLAAMRVLDIAHRVEGRVVAGNAQSGRMVTNFLIGTMQVDNFMLHLGRCPGCAVIVGGDRADLQLAALHAGSPCIILTGNIPPSELIRARAEKNGVPLIMVRKDTYNTARVMARILKSKKIRDLAQVRLAVDMVDSAIDLRSLIETFTKTAN
jgi:hypothetical protein